MSLALLLAAGGVAYGEGPPATHSGETPETTSPTTIATERLGTLSAREESGDRGVSAVSSGKGDRGGVSYGTYQFSSKIGTAGAFVDRYYKKTFKGLRPGSAKFTAAWRKLALQHPEQLARHEHAFIEQTCYRPLARRLRRDLELDLAQRSAVLADVVWSVAVQHGPATDVVHCAWAVVGADRTIDQVDDAEIIEAVYAERGRTNDAGVVVRFRSSSRAVQRAVLKRFQREKANALRRLP